MPDDLGEQVIFDSSDLLDVAVDLATEQRAKRSHANRDSPLRTRHRRPASPPLQVAQLDRAAVSETAGRGFEYHPGDQRPPWA